MYNQFNDLQTRTSQLFDKINFSEISLSWIERVIDNEFTEVEQLNITTSILFTEDPLKSINNLSKACNLWCSRFEMSSVQDSRLSNASHMEENLWTFLDNLDISSKHIQGFVFYLCTSATRKKPANDDEPESEVERKELGLACANLYFTCLKVPGSSAYKVYHPVLFQLCVDCLYIPDYFPDTRDTWWRECECLLPMMVVVLESLLPLLTTLHLGSESDTCDHVIKKLSELVGWEFSVSRIDFSIDMLGMMSRDRAHRFSWTMSVTGLSFQGLSILAEAELNGEKEHNYNYILFYLSTHLLFKKMKKKTSVTQKMHVPKDNVKHFIRYTLKFDQEIRHKVCVESLKRNCLMVSDASEIQSIACTGVFETLRELNEENIIEFTKWLLLLADSSDAGHRTFALNCLGYCMNLPQENIATLPEIKQIYLSPLPYIFSLLTRTDDVSPNVRVRALSVLSENMNTVMSHLSNLPSERDNFPWEDFDEDLVDIGVNGDHRIFWYCLGSFQSIMDEIFNILQRRIAYSNAASRCGALKAVENVIIHDLKYLSEDLTKLFSTASKDPCVTVRKQTLASLTSVLNVYPHSNEIQTCWLRCVLPLVIDPETGVQTKVLQVMEEKFLIDVFSNDIIKWACAFNLLGHLSDGEYLSHQRYLQKAFNLWQKDRKLKPQSILMLEKRLGSEVNDYVWFYIALFSIFSKIPPKISELTTAELLKLENWQEYKIMEHILKVINFTFASLTTNGIETIKSVLEKKIQDLSAAIELYPLMIEVLGKIKKHLNQNDELENFANNCIQNSGQALSAYLPEYAHIDEPIEEESYKHLCIIKEFCQMFPKNISDDLIRLLKTFVFTGQKFDNDRKKFPSSKTISPILRAHSFAAIGKLSLQDETLATDLLPLMAKEILSSSVDVIRNNVILVMIEMCKRYTSHADKYVPLICLAFKDRAYVIRYQAITMLIILLQEDFIKWKGSLFFCLMSTIVDKKESIQELGRYCLCHLLLEKKQTVFSDHFVDSIFVFNKWSPQHNERLSRCVRELQRFAMTGQQNSDQRMQIYTFMLQYMTKEQKAEVINQLCQEVLNSFASSVYPLNPSTECIIKDCFEILTCEEARFLNVEQIYDQIDEEDHQKKEEVAVIEKSTRLLTLVKPLIPIALSLRSALMDVKSSLLPHLMNFLKDILQDFKEQLPELINDKIVVMFLQTQYQREAVDQARESKKRKEEKEAVRKRPNRRPPPSATPNDSEPMPGTSSQSYFNENDGNTEEMLELNGEHICLSPDSKKAMSDKKIICSTPQVVLKRVPPELNISRISLDEDMDTDIFS